MIVGIRGVVREARLEIGRFYLAPSYGGDPALFQCVKSGEPDDDTKQALMFHPEEAQPISLQVLPDGPYVSLPDVSLRVDPPSVSGTSSTSSITGGMLLLSVDRAYVSVQLRFRNWALFDLETGLPASGPALRTWASFSRWYLIIEERFEEVRIASFDSETSSQFPTKIKF